MPLITVLVADAEKANRDSCLRLLLHEKGIRVVGEARNGLEVISATVRLRPAIILLDVSLSQSNRVSLVPIIREKSQQTKVILIVDSSSDPRILEGLSYGAVGSLDRNSLRKFLPKAVRAVDAGEAWVSRKIVAKIIDRLAHFTSRA